MKYPKLEIYLHKLHHNAKALVEDCSTKGIEVAAVTKVFCGEPQIAEAIAEAGITMLADSRMSNIMKLQHIPLPKLLLRIPMLSEVDEVVQFTDISLNSEIDTIQRLSQAALNHGKKHKIILMVDLGDLREGVWPEEVSSIVKEILTLEGVQLAGLGTNFGCYGGIIPERHSLEQLIHFKEELEAQYGLSLELLSGGNSNSLHLVWEDKIPKGINHIRLGEPIVLGKEDVYNVTHEGLYDDAFRLFAEIVEIKDKPSVPIGKRGIDAFGNIPEFEERGTRRRAIAAIGRQDVLLDGIQAKEEGVMVLGASSDHLILDIQDAGRNFKIGDIVELSMSYGALLAAMTSPYVHKEFIK